MLWLELVFLISFWWYLTFWSIPDMFKCKTKLLTLSIYNNKNGSMFQARPIKMTYSSSQEHGSWHIAICSTWQQIKIIIDSTLLLKTDKILWVNTMKVKLLCTDSLSSKKTPWVVLWKRRAQWYYSASKDELRFFHSRCHWLKLINQMTGERDRDITGLRAGIPHSTVWVFLQFTSIKLSLTLMSGPPGDIRGG